MKRFSLLAFALLLGAPPAFTAPGGLDPGFGNAGMVTTDFKGSNDLAYAIAQQTDGKLVVAGIRFVGNSATNGDFVVARYNSDGTLDQTFGRKGWVVTDFGLTETASAVAVQPDGKIVVAGGTYPTFPFLGQYA